MSTPSPELLYDQAALPAADGAALLPAAGTAGAQVRALGDQLEQVRLPAERPRALVIVDTAGRAEPLLVKAFAAAGAPAPIVVGAELPAFVGPLDLVLVLASTRDDEAAAEVAATARRRGASLVVRAADAAPVGDAARGADALLLSPALAVGEDFAAAARFALITAVARACGLLPAGSDLSGWADTLDQVALACHPGAEPFANPAIRRAERLASGAPLLVAADPVGVAIGQVAADLLQRLAGRPVGLLPAFAPRQAPGALRAAAAASTDIFHDPVDDPPAAATVVLGRSEPAAAVGALAAALPGAPVVTVQNADSPADPLLAAAVELVRWTFTAVYLGLVDGAGQQVPTDLPDGLGPAGTAMGAVRADSFGWGQARSSADPFDGDDPFSRDATFGDLR